MTARCTYLLPLRWTGAADAELAALGVYVRRLRDEGCDVVVVDGSSAPEFDRHARFLAEARHVPVDRRWRYLNGKVNGVLTGMAIASCERVVLADDDVRYGAADLDRMCRLLDEHDLVVPQNYFDVLPWWAWIETARILLNRALRSAGDFPGTFGVRRSTFARIGPYDGDVLFENEAMRRHFVRSGTQVCHARDFMIARHPPPLSKWREQRVRQAYEDLDFPSKTMLFAAVLPVLAVLGLSNVALAVAFAVVLSVTAVVLAAIGRRDGASSAIPASACLAAPVWVLERSVTVYGALLARAQGGCRYAGRTFARGLRGAAAG